MLHESETNQKKRRLFTGCCQEFYRVPYQLTQNSFQVRCPKCGTYFIYQSKTGVINEKSFYSGDWVSLEGKIIREKANPDVIKQLKKVLDEMNRLMELSTTEYMDTLQAQIEECTHNAALDIFTHPAWKYLEV